MMDIVSKTIANSRPGRPRAVPDLAPELAPREQILLAAAALFVEQGFAGTSTRAIAEAVGIRQASLYYHFAGKDDILAELLDRSVRPSTDIAGRLERAAGADPSAAAAALYALAEADVRLLTETPHNIGSLYLMPEVRDPRFDSFRTARDELQATYGRLALLAQAAANRPDQEPPLSPTTLGALLIQVVEVVIPLRRREDAAPEPDPAAIAAAVLRLVGLDHEEIRAARRGAGEFAGT
ncbi:transcriptional regulator, TetR family [Catenulispora acidiphila DSM 44928]|uniref:Transcriptional regulator, TetR family n=2 Tax=Catenulispora TaxID=414878 RepID=C7QC13_CATAD|nr:transcriptional regulator, TetR family [Catenulispora acidiphila DSM 44928]